MKPGVAGVQELQNGAAAFQPLLVFIWFQAMNKFTPTCERFEAFAPELL
jgi:hypothetical protein